MTALTIGICLLFLTYPIFSQNSQIEAYSSDTQKSAIYGEITMGTNDFISAINGNCQGNGCIGVQGYGFRGVWGIAATGEGTYAGYFDGNVQVVGDVCANNVTCPSDLRLKRDVVNSSYGLQEVMHLRPVDFYYNDKVHSSDLNSSELQTGFIAQELEEILPNLVIDNGTAIIDPNNPHNIKTYKTVNYLGLIPILTKGLQEQQQMIDALSKEVGELRCLVENMKSETDSSMQNLLSNTD